MSDPANRERTKAASPALVVMQPYLFPYLGYFQLIEASDLFVFYDDVAYITTRGWINRNRILINDRDFTFTVPVAHASHLKAINETALALDDRWRSKFNRTIGNAYSKAPHFSRVQELVASVLAEDHASVAELAIHSVVAVLDYLGTPFNHRRSSLCSPQTRQLGKTGRLYEMTRQLGYSRYVNAVGGEALYSKAAFAEQGIELDFLQSGVVQYRQFSTPFVPSLSIIDVLMFNEPSVVRNFLNMYTLV